MSAPDIGALRALHAIYRDLLQQAVAANNTFDAAVAAALSADFGPPPKGSVSEWRVYQVHNARLSVVFDAYPMRWAATAQIAGGRPTIRRCSEAPRSAVDRALAALAQTHPAEADALAAVVPTSPASSASPKEPTP